MLEIIRKYNNKGVEDWGSVMSTEAKKFCSDFKRRLNMNCRKRGWELVKFSPNHYDFSGFIKKDDRYVYFNYNIPRGGNPMNLLSRSYHSGLLVRTAEHDKDYRGGYNNFCSLENFLDSVEYLLDR